MQARTYLPSYGKFAQPDPAYDQQKDDPETWNLYTYCANNPVTHTDPDGRMFMVDGVVSVGGFCGDYEGQLGGVGGAPTAQNFWNAPLGVGYDWVNHVPAEKRAPSVQPGKGVGSGLSQTEKVKVIQSKAALIALLLEAKTSLATWDDAAKALFKEAFGTDADSARDLIAGRVDKELALVGKMTLSNFKLGTSAGAGTFAYVYPGDSTHTVNLGPAFWSAALSGVDSSPGTLAHEISHFRDIGGTIDGFPTATYGLAASRALAGRSSGMALMHADTFEYYLERAQ